MTYRQAGVDERHEQTVLRGSMLPWFRKTLHNSEGSSILGVAAGHFASILHLGSESSVALTTDGVGTKILIARAARRYHSVGMDCVANNVNDLVCLGAEPLVLLDYIAIDRIDEEVLGQIAQGLSDGAQQAGIEIAGGEIAQVGDLLAPADDGPPMFDLVGMALGVLPRTEDGSPEVLDGSLVQEGDVILGLASSGLHSNGYSLARRVLFEGGEPDLDIAVPESGSSLGDALLQPTRIYVSSIKALLDAHVAIHGLVNISGGGLLNLARLNSNVSYVIEDLPPTPPLFSFIRRAGNLSWAEMLATFNVGVGMCIVLPEDQVPRAVGVLEGRDESVFRLGRVRNGTSKEVRIPGLGLTGRDESFVEQESR